MTEGRGPRLIWATAWAPQEEIDLRRKLPVRGRLIEDNTVHGVPVSYGLGRGWRAHAVQKRKEKKKRFGCCKERVLRNE
jgi:hypothetical protein